MAPANRQTGKHAIRQPDAEIAGQRRRAVNLERTRGLRLAIGGSAHPGLCHRAHGGVDVDIDILAGIGRTDVYGVSIDNDPPIGHLVEIGEMETNDRFGPG